MGAAHGPPSAPATPRAVPGSGRKGSPSPPSSTKTPNPPVPPAPGVRTATGGPGVVVLDGMPMTMSFDDDPGVHPNVVATTTSAPASTGPRALITEPTIPGGRQPPVEA
jgi:hypothetical protein